MAKTKHQKITLTLPTPLIKKIDKIKKYPKWNENRSKVIKEILEEYFNKNGQTNKQR